MSDFVASDPVVALAAPAGLRAKFTCHTDIGPRGGDAAPVVAFSTSGEALVLNIRDGRLHPVSTYGSDQGLVFERLFTHQPLTSPLAPAPAGTTVFFTDDQAPVPVVYFDAHGRAVAMPVGSIACKDGDSNLVLVEYMENVAGVGFAHQLHE